MLIRRVINHRHAFDYTIDSKIWKKNKTPVLSDTIEGTFFDPFVRRIDGQYIMMASHRERGSIVRFTSKEGTEWTEQGIVLRGSDVFWDKTVNRPSFLVKDGLWLLWYTGQFDGKSSIGYARSTDGVHFIKADNNPVLTATEGYEGQSVMNPCVEWDEERGLFRMWYAAGENYEPDVICYAESRNGINWEKSCYNPVLTAGKYKYDRFKVGGCDVIKTNNQYVMFYIGYQNMDVARICMAFSPDGIHGWERSQHNPIIVPTRGSWDSDAVYKPTVCLENEDLLLWYNGRKGDRESIGFAKAEEFVIDCL